ncbi:Thioredoxin reductase [compost metagenome]
MKKTDYDVLVVGGGPAGLTAALTLGRGRRTVLLCDDGRPRNARAKHMQNFPTGEGIPPNEFRQKIHEELLQYPHVQRRELSVQSVRRQGGQFVATFTNQEEATFRKVLVAVGVQDELPDIPGIQELWGRSVIHCPYCHGYEFRDEAFAIIGNADYLMHMGTLAKGLSDDVAFFSNGSGDFTAEQRKIIERNQIRLYENKISHLEHEGDELRSIVLENGQKIERKVALVRVQQKPRSDIGEQLGCQKNEMGFYILDILGRSTSPGVSVAGDISQMIQTVLMACQSGQVAAAGLNYDILHENMESV